MSSSEPQGMEMIWNNHDVDNHKAKTWCITLGAEDWLKNFLNLCIHTTNSSGIANWLNVGRIDAVLSGRKEVRFFVTNKDCSAVCRVDVEKFLGMGSCVHVEVDIDLIIKSIKDMARAKRYEEVVTTISNFVTKHHKSTRKSALRKVKTIHPEWFQSSAGQSSYAAARKGKGKVVTGSGIGSGPKVRVTQGASISSVATDPPSEQGSHARSSQIQDVDTAPAAPPPASQSRGKKHSSNTASGSGSRKKVALEKVPTPLESVAIASQASRETYQDDLVDRCAVKNTTMLVDIDQIYPPIRDRNMELPQYQVRHIQPYFLGQLTQRMRTTGASMFAAPFLMLVDPTQCATKEDFDFTKKDQYKYFVIGGNHSACARADLSVEFPLNKTYRRVQGWILAKLSIAEVRNLAWCHNIDSEFRQKMSTIQRVSYIHMRYIKNKCSSNIEFKRQCAIEINLKDIGVRKDSKVLNANDNMYQLAFRLDPIWSLVRQIFEKWEEVELKGQKDKGKKKMVKTTGSGDAVPLADDMKLTEWRHMQGLHDATLVYQVLQ
ncbi:unnamed protein product [Calypogeia fissa]